MSINAAYQDSADNRNHWVPVAQAADLADLNQQLLIACQHDERRVIAGRDAG